MKEEVCPYLVSGDAAAWLEVLQVTVALWCCRVGVKERRDLQWGRNGRGVSMWHFVVFNMNETYTSLITFNKIVLISYSRPF